MVYRLTKIISRQFYLEIVTRALGEERADHAYDPIEALMIAQRQIKSINMGRKVKKRRGLM